ncbi:teichoic acid D-Ala incorporation-associated protein DltX [Weissella bombi]|uniref:D-Ala-teichoic acid biosynthesis protein n=1 Tax=Weissella bombi TaxID=1505725 RepID=A0A1C3YSD8_9LACO|nr:teichoic acid D-Ala incorporation-associated protein DltX [Weissella bombi]SCB73001.1 D-Ala-teichoic acid biosynthesis protein [Weissella bombi]
MNKIKNLQTTQRVLKFFFQTIFYTVIIFALVYLYGYSGLGQGHFIYNEF